LLEYPPTTSHVTHTAHKGQWMQGNTYLTIGEWLLGDTNTTRQEWLLGDTNTTRWLTY